MNDNSGLAESVNRRLLLASSFARQGRLYVDDASPFRDFADARNRVLALHRRHAPDAWGMYVDADQVHRPLARRIAARLDRVPRTIANIDAYERHYVGSFRWYTEIGRHVLLFRVTPDLRWEGAVHEHLVGVEGGCLVIPYVFDHYGALLSVREHATKGRLYSALGAPGNTADDREAASIPLQQYFSPLFERAIRYRGTLPDALGALDSMDRERYLNDPDVDRLIARAQSLRARARNGFWSFTYGYRWRGRFLDIRALRLVAGASPSPREWAAP
ncbi:MAG TPA: hypothetical protein VE591_04340 [Candidatus Acidoferrum sp.]|nr:hypothetical protein [Candidatus Acidoferrum sp.]